MASARVATHACMTASSSVKTAGNDAAAQRPARVFVKVLIVWS